MPMVGISNEIFDYISLNEYYEMFYHSVSIGDYYEMD